MYIKTVFIRDTGQLRKFIHLRHGRYIETFYDVYMDCWNTLYIESKRTEILKYKHIHHGTLTIKKRVWRQYQKDFEEWE